MKWEYRTEIDRQLSPKSECYLELNGLGADGWELVNVVLAAGVWYGFFKRPLAHKFDGSHCLQCGCSSTNAPEYCPGDFPDS